MANVLNYKEQAGAGSDNKQVINGTLEVEGSEFAAAKLRKILLSNEMYLHTGDAPIFPQGYTIIDGGTGISGLTLGAPHPGAILRINLRSITSGSVVVTTESGITFDGTNNTATFNAVNDELIIGQYKFDYTEWMIYKNNSVVLSLV